MSTSDLVTLDLPLEVAVQIDRLAEDMGVSPGVAVERAVSALGLLRWTVFNFGGGFPSRRLPPHEEEE